MQADERKLRVLFVNPGLYAIGGMQAWLDALMPDLEARGWECWLALPSGPYNDAAAYLRNYPWPRVHLLENPTLTTLGRLRTVERALRQVRPDVVLVANIVSVYDAIHRMRFRGEDTPRVGMCTHSNDPGIFADLDRYSDVIDGFVAPSRLMAKAAVAISGYPPERIAYASYGIDLPDAEKLQPDVRGALDILFCARLEDSQKRISDLPRIAEALVEKDVDFRLEVVGGGPDEAELRKAVERSPARDRIALRGPIAPAILLEKEMRPGRIFLVTSAWENGPIVLWQAMARRMAAVSSRYLGSRSEGTLRDAENCLLFDVADCTAAAGALARLTDPELRHRLGEAGRDTVAERYGRDVSAAAWDRALRGIAVREIRPVLSRPSAIAPAGRLDRAIGIRAAEILRRVMKRPAQVHEAGDEWPHTASPGGNPRRFLDELVNLDAFQ